MSDYEWSVENWTFLIPVLKLQFFGYALDTFWTGAHPGVALEAPAESPTLWRPRMVFATVAALD